MKLIIFVLFFSFIYGNNKCENLYLDYMIFLKKESNSKGEMKKRWKEIRVKYNKAYIKCLKGEKKRVVKRNPLNLL